MATTFRAQAGRLMCVSAVVLLGSACQATAEPSSVATLEATAQPRAAGRDAPATAAGRPSPPGHGQPTPTSAAPSPPVLAASEPFGTDVVELRGDGRTVPVAVYVADTPALRARGLMEREHLEEGTGMVFMYEADSTGRFWMRDTLIPLSIGFFDAAGDAVGFIDMEPCTTAICPRYGPDSPYRYALEVPQGWFDEQGIDGDWRLQVAP